MSFSELLGARPFSGFNKMCRGCVMHAPRLQDVEKAAASWKQGLNTTVAAKEAKSWRPEGSLIDGNEIGSVS